MAIPYEQNRFTIGELDPLMMGRSDTEFYTAAVETATNVICIPEGGLKRRPGTLYIDRLHRQLTRFAAPTITAPNGGTAANANDDDEATDVVTTTNISTTNPYVIVHYDMGAAIDIACIDVVLARLTTATNNTEFFIQVSTDDIAWVNAGAAVPMSTTRNTVRRRVRGSYRYARFVRVGATDLTTDKVTIAEFNVWEEEAAVSVAKRINFSFNIDQTYVLFLTDKNISVYRNGVFQADIRAIEYTNALVQQVLNAQTADVAILTHIAVAPHELRRYSDTVWTFSPQVFENIPRYDFVPALTHPAVTLTPSAVDGSATFTASGATFAAGSVGQFIDGGPLGGGRARIISYTSTTVVTGIIEIPFYSTAAMAAGTWDFEQGWEDTWSDVRGWPRCAAFFQQRLFFGGSTQRPRTLWGSRTADYFNFDFGSLRDTDAFEYDLDEDDPIVNLVSNRTLQIFTSGGEAAVIQSRSVPMTPTNPYIVSQTRVGSEPGLRPVIVDGLTLFVKRNGHSIGQFNYVDTEQSYNVTNLSLFSSHLIDTPVDFAVRKVTNDEEASYLMVVNTDGTLTFGCILTEQDVKGFTKATTDGLFKNVAVDSDTMYCVVQRTINGVTNNFLEQFDFDTYTDCAVQVTAGLPLATFTGLDHLEGEECRVRADGNVLANVTVAGGSATISRDAADICEIGLNFDPTIVTLPYVNPNFVPVSTGKQKRIAEVHLRLYNTAGISVNGDVVNFRNFTLAYNPLDGVAPVFTGVKKIQGLRNWDEEGQITITQTDPLPLTLLSIATKAVL